MKKVLQSQGLFFKHSAMYPFLFANLLPEDVKAGSVFSVLCLSLSITKWRFLVILTQVNIKIILRV